MGFLSRIFAPRRGRRDRRPGRAVKRTATPKAATPRGVRRSRRARHPLSKVLHGVMRPLNTKKRDAVNIKPVYRHGTCPVNHRSPEAAAKCRRTS